MVPLSQIAKPVARPVVVRPGVSYRTIGVKWWGEGAYERQTIDGSQTAAKTLSLVRDGDLIINKIWVRHGSTAVAARDVDGCAASGEFPTFELDRSQVIPRWLHWYTKTPSLWAKCGDLSRGTSGKNRIKPELFLTIEAPLPPVVEQRQIVSKIEALAAKIAEAHSLRYQAIEETEALAAAYANAVFTRDEIRMWPRRPLEEIAEVRSGVTLGRRLVGKTTKLPYLRVANVQDGHLDLSEIKEVEVLEEEVDKWRLNKGDLLLTEGGDWDKLGRGTVWREEIPHCIHQNHIFRVRTRPDEFLPEFLAALIGSPVGKAYFQDASKQTTNLASINQRQLKAFQVVQPPLSEQHRIVAYLDGLQAKVDALKALQAQTAAELEALMPAVLDAAFSGRLVAGETIAVAVPAAAAGPEPVAAKPTPFMDDAAIVCLLLDVLKKHRRPTNEFFVQKHIFVLKERVGLGINSHFSRKAAGPWSQDLKRKAIFAAERKNWLRWDGNRLVPGRSIQTGVDHARAILGDKVGEVEAAVQDLVQFGRTGLERWTTVLKATRDLEAQGQAVTSAAIQHEIDTWPDKREKEAFSEESVDLTVRKMVRRDWIRVADAGQ
jgi:type I restriction enzyme S subunit